MNEAETRTELIDLVPEATCVVIVGSRIQRDLLDKKAKYLVMESK